jgi:hypothetical protein
MAITKEAGRQYTLVADVNFAAADIPAEATYEAVDLPAGAIVTGGTLEVITTDAGGGTIAVGIGADVLLAATATSSAIQTLFTQGSAELTANDTVDVTVATAVLTTFAGRLIVNYILDGRSNEVNP